MQPGKFEYETTRKLKKTIKSDARVVDCVRLYHRLGIVRQSREDISAEFRRSGNGDSNGSRCARYDYYSVFLRVYGSEIPESGRRIYFHQGMLRENPRLRMRLVSRRGVSHERVDEFHGDSAHHRGFVRRRLLQYVRRGFFKAKDARIVADAINEAYAHKGEYENLFWDDIVDRKLKEIDLTVHPINSDTIVEIDSVKELETIDPD